MMKEETPAEKLTDWVSGEWNRTECPFPRDRTLAGLFAEQAARTPGNLAVVSAGRHLTYEQLDILSDRIAFEIHRVYSESGHGELEPGTPVGIFLERDADAIAAIVGVLKAGAAYVPIDPDYPADRTAFIIDSAGLSLVVTRRSLLELLPDRAGIDTILIDRDSPELWRAPALKPPIRSASTDTAYVLHTSGSSGDPKGVACTHRNVLNIITHFQREYPLSEGDRCCLVSNLTFDVSVYEIWSALLYGFTLYVPDRYTVFSPEDLFRYLKDHRIKSAYLPPFFVEDFARFLEEEGMKEPVKRLLVGVEPIDESLLARIKSVFPDARIINGYGPTEATICCSLYEVDGEPRSRRTPIGRPFSNIRLYVLDDEMRPVARGTPGQLYVSGACLSKGYLNRPDLTEQQFFENPFAADDTEYPENYAHLYSTDDFVVLNECGNLEFLGRKDRQLKIRGIRVEPGEVEAAIGRHERVKGCAVRAVDEGGEKKLAAYYTTVERGAPALTPPELRSFVEEALPAHMVPSYFVRVEDLPTTSHGKIDLEALPAPGEEGLARSESYVAPRTEEEETLARIFGEVLKLDKVGIHDNFFRLGGHSLTATRAAVRVQQIFGVRCPVRAIFDNPDIASLTLYISEQRARSGYSLTPIDKVERGGKLPLSYAQQRLWFLDQYEEATSTAYNLPLAFRLIGELDVHALERAVNALIERHETLRTIFPIESGVASQVILPAVAVSIVSEDVEEEGLAEALEREVHFRFDLERGPLIRVRLFKVGERESVLVINQHHIISDAWSAGILARELSDLYEAFHGGREPELPELEVQYADYACWQRDWLTGEVLTEQVDYWRENLRGFPTVELPADHPRPAAKTYNGLREYFTLDEEMTASLKEMCRKTDTTVFMTMLAALSVLIHRYTGEDDIVIGTPVANRVHPDLEGVLGFFVNTLALRCDLAHDPTFLEFLERVKKACLDAYANQDVPFEHLVDVLNVPRDISRTPVFQIMLVMQNVKDPVNLVFPGIVATAVEAGADMAKFDLAVILTEDEGFLSGVIEYNTDLFDPGTVERFISHFKSLVGCSVADPDLSVDLMPMLSEDEEREVLYDWNELHGAWPERATLHRLFEEQVKKTPAAVAVTFEGESLSYAELNARANRLARLLRSSYMQSHCAPLPPDTLVGLCLERGPEMIVAMLAVLKAGGAYVPVDPDYPHDRVSFMLRDSDVPLVVAQSGVLEKVSFMTLAGLGEREVDCAVTGARAQVRDLDRLPLPDRDSIDVGRYRRQIGMAMVKDSVAIQASRGCPYRCAYCHKIWPKSHVVRSAGHIFSEMEHYRRAGVRRFAFVDDIFNLDRKVSTSLFRMLIDSRLDVDLFFPNGLRADILTEDYMDLMVEAGTVSVALALESASPRVQKLARKNLDLEKTRKTVDYMANTYPEVALELFAMIGFPTETEEEALATLSFIEESHWLHFPYLHVLKVYPGTDMASIAMEHGVSREAINGSVGLAFHELPETLPFDKGFARMLQARFLNEYFLKKERLLATIPHQKRILTEDELVRKYDSYLPVPVKDFGELLEFCGIAEDEVGGEPFVEESDASETSKKTFTFPPPRAEALRVLLLDLSQHFSDAGEMLYDVVEEPLGLLYLSAYLREFYGDEVQVRVAKSRIDFDGYDELKRLLDDFEPQLVGMRTLTFYRDFFHRTAAMIKTWAPGVPIVAGGPYATSDYRTMLADDAIDLAVLGEGEATFAELVGAALENGARLLAAADLGRVAGIAYASGERASRDVILLDEEVADLEPESEQDLDIDSSPDGAAYVIYTSGSTGTPKGVLVEHRNVVRLLFNEDLPFDFTGRDVWSLFHSYCFDFSVWEMYGALLNGGRLVVIPRDVARDTEAFLAVLSREGVTVLNQTPGAFYNLMRFAIEPGAPPLALRHVIFGGEVLNVAALEPWFRRFGADEPRLVNMFGITETCVHVTFRPLDAEDAAVPRLGSPIGCSLPDLSMYVLDGNINPLPVGVPGELFVGGEGVARGYLNRPDLTADHFIANPYISEADYEAGRNGRLYRSGDLVRWRPGGVLEYMGRTDFQVKVRGFRVEPGEIEAALLRHPGVAQCVILQLGEGDGKRLVCYYVPEKTAGELSQEEMKAFLARNLPDYMVPQLFVRLAEMPLTDHGKTDRRALPAPGRLERGAQVEYVEPRNDAERKLAEIWRKMLKVDRVGVTDDFFSLGGDSIMSIQVISRARREGLKVTPKQLFANPTVAGMAAVAVPVEAAAAGEAVPAEGAAPLTPIQRWFFEQRFGKPEHFNQAFVVTPAEKVDIGALRKAFAEVAGRHDSFRLRFRQTGHGGWEQWYSEDAAPPPVFEVEIGADAGVTLEQACSDMQELFDIESGPVALTCVLREPGRPEKLLLAMHHLVVDGVSWRILLEDLERAYGQIGSGVRVELPYRSDTFKAWGQWLERYAKSDSAAEQWSFWLEACGVSGSIADFHGGRPVFGESIERTVVLGLAETETLVSSLPRAYGLPVEEVLLSALLIALWRLRGVERLLLHMEGHGREEVTSGLDLTRTIGWFTSLYPVSLQLPESREPRDVIASVREQLRAVPDRGIGYGALRFLSGDARAIELEKNDAAAVSFNYLGRMDAASGGDLLGGELLPAAGMMAPLNRNPHLLDCWGMVSGDELEMRFALSGRHFKEETADGLASLFEEALAELLACPDTLEMPRLRPSDFPGTSITAEKLDELARRWGSGAIESVYPLAPLQEGLLFHSRYAPHSDQYVEQLMWLYDGKLDRDALRGVWENIVEQHAVFRTAFVWDELEEPVQVVLSGLRADWREEDWRGTPEGELEEKLERYIAADREEGFDTDSPPLVRLHLLRTGDEEYRFIWTHHHLLLDGWSMSLVMDELRERYAARAAGRKPGLEPSPPFEEYVRSLAACDCEAAVGFWRRTMAGVEEATPLAFARSGSRIDIREPIENLAETVHRFSAECTEGCRRFARERRVTLNSLIQLAWAVVLGRFCGTEDVVMGMTISGRAGEIEGVEKMVGLLINTVPLPFRLDQEETAAGHLRRLHEVVREVNDNGFLPLTEIHGCSAVPPGDPLFYSLFLFENYPVEEHEDGLAVKEIDFREKTNYPVTVVVVPGDRLSVNISYDADAFSSESIERLAAYIENAAGWIVEHGDEPLALADIMPGDEKKLVLDTWSRNDAPRSGRATLVELFADAVREHGLETALSFRDQSVTYEELDRRTDALASAIRKRFSKSRGEDLPAGTIVGLMADRSVEMVVGMVGAMKAGAAYLPLDVDYPDHRLRFLIEDARVPAVLVQDRHEKRLKEVLGDAGVDVVRLDEANYGKAASPAPEDLAYAIYTSGSTGTPKGAAIEHRSAANLIEWMKSEYPVGPGDTFLQLTSFTFDVSVAEIFWTLCSGARLLLAEPGASMDIEQVLKTLRDERVTATGFVPSLFSVFVGAADEFGSGVLDSLRYVHVAGEAFPTALADRFAGLSGARLDNIYGPTEATVYSSFYPYSEGVSVPVLPIGGPVSNARLLVLDERMRPVPPEVPGELYIGGGCLARGYLYRGELTAEKFIPDPFAPVGSGARLYKTGDLARWLEDGDIEFLGRRDFQLKVRGFRVEPGEIETRMRSHPSVERCVVTARGEADDRSLVAYYTAKAGVEGATAEGLAEYLAASLPEYMVPSAFVHLDRMPLHPSGKLNRGAMPEVGAEADRARYVGPRDALEEALAAMFAGLLKIEQVGIDDDFFRMGGHSLLAVRLIFKANRELEAELTVSAVFERRTVRRLGDLIREGTRAEQPDRITVEEF